jgi:hypothetical protein
MRQPIFTVATLAAALLGAAACVSSGGGEAGSGAAYMSPPGGEYTTGAGPTDVSPLSPTAPVLDPGLNRTGRRL